MTAPGRTHPLTFRGQVLTRKELGGIRKLFRDHPRATLSALSIRVCEAFEWRLPTGRVADRSCRRFLRKLEAIGILELPLSAATTAARFKFARSSERKREGVRPSEIPWPAATADEGDPGELVVRPIRREERGPWEGMMEKHHYLGSSPLVGESLRYVAILDGKVVALLGWSAATLHNPPRDAYVGWDASTRIERLRFVVNNARFLIPGRREPNLASRVLARVLRRLGADWQAVYGHPVYLAETFVDGSRFRGTCYRASNWIELGQTRGWSKHGSQYRHHGQPKTVFVYPLHRRAREQLSSKLNPKKENVPVINIKKLPFSGSGGLIEVLRGVSDFRKRRGVRHPLIHILTLSIAGALSGYRNVLAIVEWARELSWEDRERMGARHHKPPSEKTFRRVLAGIDAARVDQVVGAWMVALHGDLEGKGIALDGKTARGSGDGENPPVHLLSAVLHQEGAVLAQMKVPNKTNEIPCVAPMLENTDVTGAVITADALHTQKETAVLIVEVKKADYVFIVKGNQPTLMENIQLLDLGSFSPSAQNDR